MEWYSIRESASGGLFPRDPGVVEGQGDFVWIPVVVTKNHSGLTVAEILSREQVSDLNFTPIALVKFDLSRMKDAGVEFSYEQDDLDEYAFAAFSSPQFGNFAFMSYLNTQNSEMTLMLEDSVLHMVSVAAAIHSIADELKIPVELFHWRFAGEEVRIPAKPSSPSHDVWRAA